MNRIGVLVADLTAIALGALMIGCCSCQSVAAPVANHYTVEDQHTQTVAITELCVDPDSRLHIFLASGIRYTNTLVLTAAHVVEPPKDFTCMWSGSLMGADAQMLAPGMIDHDRDLGILQTITGRFEGDADPPIATALPVLGDTVCEVAASPYHVRRCGEVGLGHDELPHSLDTTMIVEPGNSGSPVYNNRGELVGIVSAMWQCGNGQICGSLTSEVDTDELHYLLTGFRL